MPRAPNSKTYSADDAAGLSKAASDLDTNPPLNDTESWLGWAQTMLEEAATTMQALEEERDELKARVADLEGGA